MRHKSKIIFSRIVGIYLVTLLGILAVVLLTINECYVDFIKRQRVEYNQQLLSKAAYEMNNFYVHSEYLLEKLSREDKYSIDKFSKDTSDQSVFEKIKQEIDFEQEILQDVYTNGVGEYTKGILIFNDEGTMFYTGMGVFQDKIFIDQVLNCVQEESKKSVSVVQLSTESNKMIGLLKREKTSNRSVLLIINFDKISKMLEQSLLHNKSYCILDASGEVIYENNMELFKNISDFQNLNKETFEQKYHVVLTSVSLDLFSCDLYVVDKPQIIFEDINQLWKKVLSIIGIGCVLGTGLFLSISRKVLFPISQIKQMIHDVALDCDTYLEDTSNDEFGEISKMINFMKSKIKEMSEEQMLLEMKTTEARLQVLQAQINPHFLYNTLDNMYCIAQVEEIQPITILAKNLSEMLRYSINTEQMFVTLEEEIRYIQAYLEIINVRYDNIIELEVDIPEELKTCYVFRLLLQPLVENACLHGILPSETQRGNIYITAIRKENDIFIKVVNNGIILSDQKLEELNKGICKEDANKKKKTKGTGIALSNVNERVQLFYGDIYGIEISRINHFGTCVTIHQRYTEFIPQKKNSKAFSDKYEKTIKV